MVKLVQLLCPKRHCIMGVAYLDGKDTFVGVCNRIEDIIREGPLNRWCGICGSRDLKFKETTTPWKTIPEAYPHLKAAEADQIATRYHLNATGQALEPIDMDWVKHLVNRHSR